MAQGVKGTRGRPKDLADIIVDDSMGHRRPDGYNRPFRKRAVIVRQDQTIPPEYRQKMEGIPRDE